MRGIRVFVGVVCAVVFMSGPVYAEPGGEAFVSTLKGMMADLKPTSRANSAAMRKAYAPRARTDMIRNRAGLKRALDTEEIATLPADPAALNITVRTKGYSPIAEKDLAHQEWYIAARPATLGLLMHVAAQVTSSPIEVTSLVRHLDYQRKLQRTNRNARTSVPTHAMGHAFDIALVNTPLKTAYEIRDVLRRMRRNGDLIFIGEIRQLVFHVVPTPARHDYYAALYEAYTLAPMRAADIPEMAAPAPRPVPAPPVMTAMTAGPRTDDPVLLVGMAVLLSGLLIRLRI